MAEYVDPFTTVYRAIREGILAWSGINRILTKNGAVAARIANVPDLSRLSIRDRPTEKAPNDFPEIWIEPSSFHLEPFANSRSAKFGQSYRVIGSDGLYNISNPGLLKIQMLAALTALGPDLGLAGLVHCWTITDGMNEMQSHIRPHSGWTTLLSINVEMSMSRTDLLAI